MAEIANVLEVFDTEGYSFDRTDCHRKYQEIRTELQNLFRLHSDGGPGVESLVSKAFLSARSARMSYSEFTSMLKTVGLLPKKLAHTDAASIFRRANRTDISDDDRHEFDYDEFEYAMTIVAKKVDMPLSAIVFARSDQTKQKIRYIEHTVKMTSEQDYMQQVSYC